MIPVTLCKAYPEPPICKGEILRYAACDENDPTGKELLEVCLNEVAGRLSYKVCYHELPLTVSGGVCDFAFFRIRSDDLSEFLRGCERVIVFAATLGVEIDRLIARYGRLSPSKAIMLQAIGAERIEALCDEFCRDIKREYGEAITSRFSPGYGDLSLEVQRELFDILDCSRKIGLALNESLIMSPTKSVTAFVGIHD